MPCIFRLSDHTFCVVVSTLSEMYAWWEGHDSDLIACVTVETARRMRMEYCVYNPYEMKWENWLCAVNFCFTLTMYLPICGLCSDANSSSGYIPSNYRMFTDKWIWNCVGESGHGFWSKSQALLEVPTFFFSGWWKPKMFELRTKIWTRCGLCIFLLLLGNHSVRLSRGKRRVFRGVDFCAIRVVSKEHTRLFLPINYCLFWNALRCSTRCM
jgi:hypothetical protein